MIKVKIFKVDSFIACTPISEEYTLAPMEEFIAQIGYDSIKNIIVSSSGGGTSFYSIFYEDGMPYTPRPTPEKKGLFGR